MNKTETTLEFGKIKEQLKEHAYTQAAKEKIEALTPFLSEREMKAKLRETTEAKNMLEKMGNPPIASFDDAVQCMEISVKGGCLTGDQLEKIGIALASVNRMKSYLCNCKQLQISLAFYEENLNSLEQVREEIAQKIRGGNVDDYATKLLKTLRSDGEKIEQKMREKADAALRTYKMYLSEQFCTERNGHLCIPVKKEYKSKVSGSVIDQSSTGNTFFMEPSQVAKYAEELALKKLEEENEERRILYELSGLVADRETEFMENQRTIERLDFVFAKGKLSMDYDGVEPTISPTRTIEIQKGRHPLMDKTICVPLDFRVGEDVKGVIITGPNTGGKTVAIKTVGLNCMMAQCGLHVSCQRANICMNSQILCDIGDGQNISENLSTFSAHIMKVLEILKKVNQDSLVIMDELGSGTDPTEGMGIAIAILEELRKSGALFLVTTHYPEVKNYAKSTSGIENARMAFDKESLKPLYHLEIGSAGESCAFHIAKRLGMPGSMLKAAAKAAYGSEKEIELALDTQEELKKEMGQKLQKEKKQLSRKNDTEEFSIGDSVMVYPTKKLGIVCGKVNEKGMVRVQMPDEKVWFNHKRVKLHVKASQLYPEDYDFSIIFDSVVQRKARHNMERKYDANIEITVEE